MPKAVNAFSVALFAISLGGAALAAPTTTKEVGDRLGWLKSTATCQDFDHAISTAMDPNQSTEDILTVILAIAFIEGYAQGSGKGIDGRAAFQLDCIANPSRPFSTVGK